jgi:hypothetical protein
MENAGCTVHMGSVHVHALCRCWSACAASTVSCFLASTSCTVASHGVAGAAVTVLVLMLVTLWVLSVGNFAWVAGLMALDSWQ